MKTRTIFLRIVAFCAIFFIVSCSKNSKSPQNLISSEKTANSSEDPLVHVPMPAKLDSAMRKSFDAETYVELKKLNSKNVKSFYITKENYLSMIDNLPENAEKVVFSFVQFNKSKFPNKYKELYKFDGSLYMLFYYLDKDGNNITGKTYAVLSIKNAVEVSEADFNTMFQDYKTNIKPEIDHFVKGPQGNTLSVHLAKSDLLAYKEKLDNRKDIGKFKITLAQWVNVPDFVSKGQIKILSSRLSAFTEDSAGQMTFITDCENLNGEDINSLSGDDMNKLCPQDCP